MKKKIKKVKKAVNKKIECSNCGDEICDGEKYYLTENRERMCVMCAYDYVRDNYEEEAKEEWLLNNYDEDEAFQDWLDSNMDEIIKRK